MSKYDQAAAKRAMNAAFAAKFGKRKRKAARRKAKTARQAAIELAWLNAHGIERDPEHPLVRGR